jgi:acyl-coenzyme A synthetase/AMP-(fatty) acid ligase
MSLSRQPLLPAELRVALAADQNLGGGNLLPTALAAHPRPDVPFIRSGRPLINAAGRPQTEFSLRQLDELAQSWSVWYFEQGIRPRDRVTIYLSDSFAYSVHFYALAQIGAIPVLVNSKASQQIALGLCRQTSPVGIYTDHAHLETLGAEIRSLPDLRWVQLAEELPAPPAATLADNRRFRHAGEDPVSIMHSSGTTGRPKAVIQTHASSVAGPKYRLVNFTEPDSPLMMTAQPQSHLGCIVYTTYAVLAGTPLIGLYDPSGAQLAAALREHRPKTVMAFAHAYGELAALDLPPGSIDSVQRWINMGDAIHEAQVKAILAKRSEGLPPAVFYDRFGTTELGWGLVVQPRTLTSARSDRRVGKPDAVAEVAVLRKDGSQAAAGEVGFFGAKGPTITAGYWNDSDTTYRSKLGGYWLTGDLVYQDADGNFFQVDRASDAIETGTGTGYSVLMEELLLSEVSEIQDCAVVAGRRGNRIVPVAVVVTGESVVEPEKLLSTANEALHAAGYPELEVLEVAVTDTDFPVGVTGKVLKRQLREKYSSLSSYLRDSGKTVASVTGEEA